MFISGRAPIPKLENGLDILLNTCSMIGTRTAVRYSKCRHCPILLRASREEVDENVVHMQPC